MIAGTVSIVIAAAVGAIGGTVKSFFQSIAPWV
jgi:Flp pilus assembly pilin Flp